MAVLLGVSLPKACARLGDASSASVERKESGTAQATSASTSQTLFGYEFYSSTSIYGETPMTACGSLDTKALVEGTGYFAVASAQSMQAEFPDLHGGGCSFKCQKADGTPIDRCEYVHPPNTFSGASAKDGCSCVQVGTCMCGKAGAGTGQPNSTAPMGCFTCGRGRFVQRNPYELSLPPDSNGLIGPEIKVVVADVCPYGPNEQWCPPRAGEANAVGALNHLDFATAPPIGAYFNNFFVFSPEPCPEILLQRTRATSTCPASTWPTP